MFEICVGCHQGKSVGVLCLQAQRRIDEGSDSPDQSQMMNGR